MEEVKAAVNAVEEDHEEIGSNPASESIHQLDLSSEALVTSTLNIRGNKITTTLRPRTSPYKRAGDASMSREDLRSPDSVAATYTIRENRSERQTKVKLESLERRLKANEKARKEIEAEAEKWKDRATRNSKRLPELELELAETVQAKEEWQVKSQEMEIQNKQLVEELNEVQKKLEEIENSQKTFHQKVVSTLNLDEEYFQNPDEEQDGSLSQFNMDVLEQEIVKYQEKCISLKQENEILKEKLQQLSSSLTVNQNHVSTLMDHLEINKEQSREIQGICKKEIAIRQDHENRINHDVTLLNSLINEQKMELEMLKAEIRCLRSYSQEMSQSNKNNIILLKSAETERKSLLETLTVLLNSEEEATENNVKRTIRDLVRERDTEQTKRFEAEKAASNAEGVLLEQAKQQRNALFRARVSEEEYSKSMEKIEELEQELLASDLERKNLEHKIASLENCISKVSQLLNVNVGGVFDAIFDRIEELIAQESVYRVVVNENRLISENIFRGLQSVRKDFQSGKSGGGSDKKQPASPVAAAAKIIQERHTLKTIDKMDKLNKDLLATMTIETLKAADIEKTNLKKRMNEQDARIRQLEREKKEGERIRSIIAKWEKRNIPKTEKSSPMKKVPPIENFRAKSQTSITGLSPVL
ncbi:uncharacterized protein CELE_C27D6.1 [Caenorhabditis elegans]|uniref:Uncharacterized protein n=1 Tax=Caenorhabditis elegans TaxID=6239 RepID=UPI000DF66073|nr:Uncharacterized protein CELE_C27D6.1 [Caenorhabditis elegans]CCD65809.2 Uncharacterized protein CELE_C27D6.1 [Caenorhabditis elegans]|eukprot:NP_001352249.1 Uncharacterized protein CELE_C27D6.1 [Caenorhabditis elegans]